MYNVHEKRKMNKKNTNKKNKQYNKNMKKKNKPDRATMRPGCVSACIDHVTYVWRDRRVKRLSKHVG